MNSTILIPVFLLAAVVSSPAWATTVNGRITYIDEKARQIVIHSSDQYGLAPSVDVAALAVGESVRLDVTTQSGRQIVTAVRKLG